MLEDKNKWYLKNVVDFFGVTLLTKASMCGAFGQEKKTHDKEANSD